EECASEHRVVRAPMLAALLPDEHRENACDHGAEHTGGGCRRRKDEKPGRFHDVEERWPLSECDLGISDIEALREAEWFCMRSQAQVIVKHHTGHEVRRFV